MRRLTNGKRKLGDAVAAAQAARIPSWSRERRSRARLYAELCGLTLARANAKSGDAAIIGGYLGNSDVFDQAMGDFAHAYADQIERDHAKLVAAVKSGRINALIEEDP